jgi:hypothetical protein
MVGAEANRLRRQLLEGNLLARHDWSTPRNYVDPSFIV